MPVVCLQEAVVRKQLQSLDEMVALLQSRGVEEVVLSGKVATTTTPRGEQITFRGRLVAAADLAAGEAAEYVEEVDPHVTQPEAPELDASEETATDLQRAQLALARQLRAYREEYQAPMDAARARLAEAFRRAGIAVVEGEG
jgi:hypothetical protein